jgi:hypothetical protein
MARRHAAGAALLSIVAAACGSQAPAVPQNGTDTARPQVTVASDQALGWIGIAPRPARDAGSWIPAGAQAVLVVMPAEGLAAGATLSAIDTAGRVTKVTAGPPAKVPYGCDDQQLEVLPFTGARSAPGPVWLLPPSAPATWTPRPLAFVSPATATEARRRDTVGPLSLELERTDATHGTLKIVRDGRALHTVAIARGQMEGADPGPLDLRYPGVAIPVPVAAWSLVEGGPILLVLHVPSYEGSSLKPILVQEPGTRDLPEMGVYLYQCAF